MATPVKYRNGLIGTCLFHGTVLLLLLYMAFRTPLPLPAEQGILVDFGNSNTGRFDFEPRMSEPAPAVQPQPPVTPETQPEEQILTQDTEEAVALPSKPKTKEQPKKKPEEKAKEPPKPAERTVNQQAMFPGRGASESTATSQDEADGKDSQRKGVGQGSDGGGGNSFDLGGRGLAGNGQLPEPIYVSQEYGKVVVNITVDKDGNVTDATFSNKGSTILDNYLIDVALKAARKAKFARKPDSPLQRGTITYNFKVQGE